MNIRNLMIYFLIFFTAKISFAINVEIRVKPRKLEYVIAIIQTIAIVPEKTDPKSLHYRYGEENILLPIEVFTPEGSPTLFRKIQEITSHADGLKKLDLREYGIIDRKVFDHVIEGLYGARLNIPNAAKGRALISYAKRFDLPQIGNAIADSLAVDSNWLSNFETGREFFSITRLICSAAFEGNKLKAKTDWGVRLFYVLYRHVIAEKSKFFMRSFEQLHPGIKEAIQEIEAAAVYLRLQSKAQS